MAVAAKRAARMAKNRLFVSRIHWTCSEHVLKSYFEEFGPVNYAAIVYDKDTGLTKRYGFIDMKEEADYQRILDQRRHIVEGYPLVVTRCAKYGKPVRAVPHNMDDMGTPVDIDGFDSGGDADVPIVDENTRTRKLDTESSV